MYNWDESTSQWVGYYKDEYTYDLAFAISDLILPPFDLIEIFHLDVIANKPIDWIVYYFSNNTWVEHMERTYYFSENAVDVSDLMEAGIKVFPNPATDFIAFDMDNSSATATIEMFDLQGRKVLYQVVNDKNISVSHLAKGLYMYKIQNNDRVYNGKIVVE